jgi:hypothetical protein
METLSDEQVRDVLLGLQPSCGRPHGEDWTRCGEQQEAMQHWLVEGLRRAGLSHSVKMFQERAFLESGLTTQAARRGRAKKNALHASTSRIARSSQSAQHL